MASMQAHAESNSGEIVSKGGVLLGFLTMYLYLYRNKGTRLKVIIQTYGDKKYLGTKRFGQGDVDTCINQMASDFIQHNDNHAFIFVPRFLTTHGQFVGEIRNIRMHEGIGIINEDTADVYPNSPLAATSADAGVEVEDDDEEGEGEGEGEGQGEEGSSWQRQVKSFHLGSAAVPDTCNLQATKPFAGPPLCYIPIPGGVKVVVHSTQQYNPEARQAYMALAIRKRLTISLASHTAARQDGSVLANMKNLEHHVDAVHKTNIHIASNFGKGVRQETVCSSTDTQQGFTTLNQMRQELRNKFRACFDLATKSKKGGYSTKIFSVCSKWQRQVVTWRDNNWRLLRCISCKNPMPLLPPRSRRGRSSSSSSSTSTDRWPPQPQPQPQQPSRRHERL